MIQTLKRLLLAVVLTFSMALPIAVPATVAAQANIQEGLCAGANLSAEGKCNQQSIDEAKGSVNNILTTVINIF